jgi:hypothetical protein
LGEKSGILPFIDQLYLFYFIKRGKGQSLPIIKKKSNDTLKLCVVAMGACEERRRTLQTDREGNKYR